MESQDLVTQIGQMFTNLKRAESLLDESVTWHIPKPDWMTDEEFLLCCVALEMIEAGELSLCEDED